MNEITSHLELLHQQLNTTASRHRVVSNNIANVNTPGFKAERLRVGFEEELANYEHEPNDLHNTKRLDGNTVDIHYELGQLKTNSLLHSVLTRSLNSKVRQLQRAMDSR